VYQSTGPSSSWFDALLVGLTATPKDEIDRNTYSLFGPGSGVPTDAYGLDEAVAEGYLVPPGGVGAAEVQRAEGIRYDELSEDEKDQWDALEWDEEGGSARRCQRRGGEPSGCSTPTRWTRRWPC
jgi:type I restriction enzyme R subunit